MTIQIVIPPFVRERAGLEPGRVYRLADVLDMIERSEQKNQTRQPKRKA